MNGSHSNDTSGFKKEAAGPAPDGSDGPVLFRRAVSAWKNDDMGHAATLLRRAVSNCPHTPEYREALGELLIEQNQYEEAVQVFETLIGENPSRPAYYFHCGIALERTGRLRQAARYFLRAADLDPQWDQALFNAGTLCHRLNLLQEARQAFETCLQHNPNLDAAWINLGNVLQDAGKTEEAYHCWRQALVLSPDNSLAHYNIGTYYQSLDKLPEAVDAYRQALRCDPGMPKPYLNMAICFRHMGDTRQALEILQNAVASNPDYALAWYNLASVHREQGDTHKAIACYKKVVSLEPDNDAAWYNLSISLRKNEHIGDALAACSRALRITPGFAHARAYLFQLSQHACDWDLADRLAPDLDRQTAGQLAQNRKPAESPMLSLRRWDDPQKNFRVSRAYSDTILSEISSKEPLCRSGPLPSDSAGRRMRIGYLSADFKDHAVAHQIRGLLSGHDRKAFEVYGYACNPPDESDYTGRIRDACDYFIDLHALNDRDAACRINRDRIDILVDMMGHTRGSRLAISALRPSPVQVSYLGFLGTTGSAFIDYCICDAVVVPPEHAAFYSEKLVYLPDCYQVNDDRMPVARNLFSRRQCGLPEKAIVFCSFNQPYKIDRPLFEAWMHILALVPGSVLWLLGQNETAMNNLRNTAAKTGIQPDRLIFAGAMRIDRHLSRLALADIALDPFIYNGGATTANALWAGVPLVTKMGGHFVSRMSASALKAVGLSSLIAHTDREYETIAVNLARDHRMRMNLRRHLESNRRTLPLFDTGRFTRYLESAYRHMIATNRRGLPAQSFTVQNDESVLEGLSHDA